MCHDIPTQVGYPEALTDPSYRGQILVLTFPLVGNYGVPSMDTKDKWDLPLYFESDDVQIAGLVVSNYSADPSHWASQQSLGNWLAKACTRVSLSRHCGPGFGPNSDTISERYTRPYPESSTSLRPRHTSN